MIKGKQIESLYSVLVALLAAAQRSVAERSPATSDEHGSIAVGNA